MAVWLRTIHQHERGIVERFGKFKNILEPGLYYILPSLFDSIVEKIDMRERVIDVPPQSVITKDNVSVEVDAVIYSYVSDPKAVRYEVQNFYIAVISLA